MINTDINGNIGIISIDRPPVNAINPELVSSLTESLDDFNTFSIKMVLQSDNTANVPLVENFRAIALST